MRKKQPGADALVRVALYIRVSGEEQKIKGLSLEAQQERLETYAKERGEFDIAFSIAVILLVLTFAVNISAKLIGKRLKKASGDKK